jgi:hypothetical protein
MTAWRVPLNSNQGYSGGSGTSTEDRLRQAASDRLAALLLLHEPKVPAALLAGIPLRLSGAGQRVGPDAMRQAQLSDLPLWPNVMNPAVITQGPRSLKTTLAFHAQQEAAARDQDWVDIGDKLEIYGYGPCLPRWEPDSLNVRDNLANFKEFICDLSSMNSGAQWKFVSLPMSLHGVDKARAPWLQVGDFSSPGHSCVTLHCQYCEQTPGTLTFGWKGPWSCQCTKEDRLADLPSGLGDHTSLKCDQCRLRSWISVRAASCRRSASRAALSRVAQVKNYAGWFTRRQGPAPAPRDFPLVFDLTATSDDEKELREAEPSQDTQRELRLLSQPEPEPEFGQTPESHGVLELSNSSQPEWMDDREPSNIHDKKRKVGTMDPRANRLCGLCSNIYAGFGHDAYPVKELGRCCDNCNRTTWTWPQPSMKTAIGASRLPMRRDAWTTTGTCAKGRGWRS